MMSMLRAILTVLTGANDKGRLVTLIFHRVTPDRDELFPEEVDQRRFDQICGWLAQLFNVLPLPLAVQLLSEGRLPHRSLCITFDDGYADNWTIATPILLKHRLPATFFIATAFLDGGLMWNDTLIESIRRSRKGHLDLECDLGLGNWVVETLEQKRRALEDLLPAVKHLPHSRRLEVVEAVARRSGSTLPVDLMMTSEQLQSLHRSGMLVGAHTATHPILSGLDDGAIAEELRSSKTALERLLQVPITTLAYPNGRPGLDYDERAVRAAHSEGFTCAVTTARGVADRLTDRLQIPRFTPWDRSPGRFGLRIAGEIVRSRWQQAKTLGVGSQIPL